MSLENVAKEMFMGKVKGKLSLFASFFAVFFLMCCACFGFLCYCKEYFQLNVEVSLISLKIFFTIFVRSKEKKLEATDNVLASEKFFL